VRVVRERRVVVGRPAEDPRVQGHGAAPVVDRVPVPNPCRRAPRLADDLHSREVAIRGLHPAQRHAPFAARAQEARDAGGGDLVVRRRRSFRAAGVVRHLVERVRPVAAGGPHGCVGVDCSARPPLVHEPPIVRPRGRAPEGGNDAHPGEVGVHGVLPGERRLPLAGRGHELDHLVRRDSVGRRGQAQRRARDVARPIGRERGVAIPDTVRQARIRERRIDTVVDLLAVIELRGGLTLASDHHHAREVRVRRVRPGEGDGAIP